MATATPDVVIAKPSIGFAPEKKSASSPNPEDKVRRRVMRRTTSHVQPRAQAFSILFEVLERARRTSVVMGVWW